MRHSISSQLLHEDRILVSSSCDNVCMFLSGTTGIILLIHSQNLGLYVFEPKSEEEIKILLNVLNKRPMGNIVHLNDSSHNKIRFRESYTIYRDNVHVVG